MAIFRFRLASLLHVKEQLEKSAKNELGVAVTRLEQERGVLRAIGVELECLRDDFALSVTGSIDTGRIHMIRSRIGAREGARERQNQVVKEAGEAVDRIRDRVVVLMQERKVLEKLRERELDGFHQEELREEQKLVDELVTYRGRSGKPDVEEPIKPSP